jgi:hypothetical protein
MSVLLRREDRAFPKKAVYYAATGIKMSLDDYSITRTGYFTPEAQRTQRKDEKDNNEKRRKLAAHKHFPILLSGFSGPPGFAFF